MPLVPCTGIFLGPSKSGKTVALISLILEQYRGVFERIYVFSPSVNIDDGWIPVKKYKETSPNGRNATPRPKPRSRPRSKTEAAEPASLSRSPTDCDTCGNLCRRGVGVFDTPTSGDACEGVCQTHQPPNHKGNFSERRNATKDL